MMSMHKYSELNNLENLLLEIQTGGSATSEDIAVLLNITVSTASNLLRLAHTHGYLIRKNVNPHEKCGGPKYQYSITSKARKRIDWINETKLA